MTMTQTPATKSTSSDSKAKKQTKEKEESFWSLKTDDFFPYSDCENCFWTGYFTSRAAFKRYERVASSFLLAARQIEAIRPLSSENDDTQPLYKLEDALGVAQHHDAVSGTAKQHVANDYSKRIAIGMKGASKFVIETLKQLLLKPSDSKQDVLEHLSYCQLLNETICEVSQDATKDNKTDLYVIVYNALAYSNRSSVIRLPVSTKSLFEVSRVTTATNDENRNLQASVASIENPLYCPGGNEAPYVLIFHTGPLPALGAQVFRIQTSQPKNHKRHPMLVSSSTLAQVDNRNDNSNKEDSIQSKKQRKLRDNNSGREESDSTTVDHHIMHFENGFMKVQFNSSTGLLHSVSMNKDNDDEDVTFDISQVWGYYTSFDASRDRIPPTKSGTQNSGAYIFRPSVPDEKLHILSPNHKPKFFKIHGNEDDDGDGGTKNVIGIEVYTDFGSEGQGNGQPHDTHPWIKQVTRIYKDVPYIEVKYMVGPVPIDDGRGREIVTRYSAPVIKNNAIFYTDSNGREFMKRKRNYRPTWDLSVYEPVAGNYYPVNAAIYIEDNNSSLSVLTDRTQAGSSLIDGTIELMVQRRLVRDEGRGVDEPLNETTGGVTPYPPYGNRTRIGEGVVIRGVHRIMVGGGSASKRRSSSSSASGGASLARYALDETYSDPLVFVGTSAVSSSSSNKDGQSLSSPFKRGSFSALNATLPRNVMLITYKKLRQPYYESNKKKEDTFSETNFQSFSTSSSSSLFLIRLAHQYGIDEDEGNMSKPASIDLTSLFAQSKLVSVVETTLTGNEAYNDWIKRRLDWTGSGPMPHSRVGDVCNNAENGICSSSNTTIELKAMEIRTFVVELELLGFY